MKRFLKWFFSIVLVLVVFAGGGFALAKYNTNSMAHHYYEKLVGATEKATGATDTVKTIYQVPVAGKNDSAAKKVDSAMKANRISGSVIIVRNGQVTYSSTRGQSKYPDGAKNTRSTKYQIGSAQDFMTAASVMYLKQVGKLKLSDKLSQYYPQISQSGKVTIRQLLNMTSGLSNTATAPETQSFSKLLQWNVKHVDNTAITGTYSYQAVNYVLLAGIIQKVSGQSYKEFVQTHLISKLHLKNSGFALNDAKRSLLANPYADDYSGDKNYVTGMERQQNTKFGPYQLYMSDQDLMTTYLYIFNGKFINKGNLNSLIVHSKSTFAGGVYRDKISFSVHGQLGGYQNSIKFSRDFKNGVVLLSNYVPKRITPTQTSSIIYNAVFN
ncbi:serine hydrolase domain-containing protein [Pediococcus parvulus]|uniref:serine hydrolase domain-containing protein n=1 Tax=Pediococcus parvulus TaxID=54062 RepID=UPI003CFD5540